MVPKSRGWPFWDSEPRTVGTCCTPPRGGEGEHLYGGPVAKDVVGETPLHRAAIGGHLAAAEALLRAGADVGAKGRGGITPLDVAQNNKHEQVVELLRRHGAQ